VIPWSAWLGDLRPMDRSDRHIDGVTDLVICIGRKRLFIIITGY
jgi:hypothetical protein